MTQDENFNQKLSENYQIESRLGEGGMGEVYLASDRKTGKNVAIKVLSRQLSSRPEALERFRREAETLRKLDHPNIVKLVDAFEREGQFEIVMEYIPSGSLHDLLKRGPLPIDRARQISLELCDALIRSHHLGIVHRDLKPENVLMAEDGTPKLADFGVARLTEGSRMTRTGTKVGTPYYMSPEAWKGEVIDEQTDIWSLGVMMFEMLAGQVPFDGDSEFSVMTKVTTTLPPDLKEQRTDTPLGLVKIIERMLTREKEDRYLTMREVAADLERGEPVITHLPKRSKSAMSTRVIPPAPPLSFGRNRTFVIIGVVVIISLMGVVAMLGQSSAATLFARLFRLDIPTSQASNETDTVSGSPPAPTSINTGEITPITFTAAPTVPPLLFQDDFSDPGSGWDTGRTDEFLSDYHNGGLRIKIDDVQRQIWVNPGLRFEGDIRLEVYATQLSGVDNNSFGLICRQIENESGYQYYFSVISSQGFAAIGKMLDSQPTYLVRSSSAVPQINAGRATNRINMDCIGNNITLYANGIQILAASDSDFTSGDVGLIAGTFEEAGTEILFDNFSVSRP
jgi:serine/threonine protein kinase